MNIKSKLLMVVSAVGISTVFASEFQTNPEETLTITEALAAAVQRGDTIRAQELSKCLQVMAEAQKVLQDIVGEWGALKAEMEVEGLAAGVDSDIQTFGLPGFSKIDTFAEEILTIVPEALAMQGGAVQPKDADIQRLASKIEHLGDALDAFGDRVTTAIESADKRSDLLAEQTQTALIATRVKETNKERVLRVCGDKGIVDWFVEEFNESQVLHRYNWATLTDAQLKALMKDFLSNGYITMKKPLDFSAVAESRAVKKTTEYSEKSKKDLVLKACKNPDVPGYLIDQFIPEFSQFLKVNGWGWSDVSEAQLTHYIDQFLRNGGF